jgi:hypothetical protein
MPKRAGSSARPSPPFTPPVSAREIQQATLATLGSSKRSTTTLSLGPTTRKVVETSPMRVWARGGRGDGESEGRTGAGREKGHAPETRRRPSGSPVRGVERVAQAVASRLKASTTRKIESPGKIAIHGAWLRKRCAVLSIEPQLGLGGCWPRPRKRRLASAMIAVAMASVRLYQHRRHDVGQDVAHGDAPARVADRARGLDVVLDLDRHGGAAREADEDGVAEMPIAIIALNRRRSEERARARWRG